MAQVSVATAIVRNNGWLRAGPSLQVTARFVTGARATPASVIAASARRAERLDVINSQYRCPDSGNTHFAW
jgi:hypothetical protein